MIDQTPEAHFSGLANKYLNIVERWPLSWIRPRERAAVLELAEDFSGARLLELGCGAGYYTRLFLAAGAAHVTAVDISASMIEALPEENITGVVSDAALVDIKETFDFLVSAGMLEFVPDPVATMTNARRHAREGARMVVLMPRNTLGGFGYKLFHRSHGLSIRLFSQTDARALFEETGWQVEVLRLVAPFTMVFGLRAGPEIVG